QHVGPRSRTFLIWRWRSGRWRRSAIRAGRWLISCAIFVPRKARKKIPGCDGVHRRDVEALGHQPGGRRGPPELNVLVSPEGLRKVAQRLLLRILRRALGRSTTPPDLRPLGLRERW